MNSNNREGVTAAKGFLAGSIRAGIKPSSTKDDVALIYSEVPCTAAAVYTTNVVKAAPLHVTKKHLENGKAQAVIVNSGNANAACNNGIENAQRMAEAAARCLSVSADDVIVASTGVIGQELPVEPIEGAIDQLVLSDDGSKAANLAIMTTDTRTKSAQVSFFVDGIECQMGGICKGSGMIHPNMGTMLCFITTDCAISRQMLSSALKHDVKKTFNRISVDGDTSTNDMVCVLANGLAGNEEIIEKTENFYAFENALRTLMEILAIEIARDGEGASRLITATVGQAKDEQQAETLARSIVSSNLLKAAVFGADANWGRVICAMGYSGAVFDPEIVDIVFASQAGEIAVCLHGREVSFDEELAKKILTQDSIDILVRLHEGEASATCWGCDLTYDYVRINGDYRT